eukprot:768019-Hanusia_phi.AAC.2
MFTSTLNRIPRVALRVNQSRAKSAAIAAQQKWQDLVKNSTKVEQTVKDGAKNVQSDWQDLVRAANKIIPDEPVVTEAKVTVKVVDFEQ